jgi:ligand-binding sensor protein
MELTDIAPLDVWAQLENDAYEKFKLQSSVFNAAGIRITGTKNWANPLCPKIKSTDKGQTFICATAHMNMANEARQTREPVIEECDAGLVKIVVPIMVNDEFIGAAGGCGLLLNDGEVDAFAVNKITDIDEASVAGLSENIPVITTQTAQAACEFFTERIRALTAGK